MRSAFDIIRSILVIQKTLNSLSELSKTFSEVPWGGYPVILDRTSSQAALSLVMDRSLLQYTRVNRRRQYVT